ncbi:AAA family ATPase [Salinibacterium soli]|uniref:Regulator n=1 Tax=Antiquaquibacter soli TaxID=3064523 RepID=A0ABT9BJI9_9MICO|nr:regulator [Protaetiibacter sp. WY-16]MDO7881189.1 regulator [Protaetiibacter sp. WY-16]
MARVALALPDALAQRLAHDASRHGHEVVADCIDGGELREAMELLRPSCALVLADPRYLDADVLASADAVGVRLVALAGTSSERGLAARLGVRETADTESDWAGLEPLLGGFGRSDTPAPAAHGTVIAVWGPGGAPGRTTVAISIAAELAALGHRVVLADVDTHGASVAPALGLLDEAPGFAAACRLAGTDSLTHDELDRIAQFYESPAGGFRVLTGIGRASRWPELSAEKVSAALERARSWADVVVVDTASSLEADEEISSDFFAPRRNAATFAALRSADHLVVVGSADPVGLSRLLRSHADMLEAAERTDAVVVMNRVRSSAMGLGAAAQVRQALARFGGIHDAVLVPYDQHAFDSAVLAGRTVTDAAPRSPARVVLRDLAASILPPPPRRVRSRRKK